MSDHVGVRKHRAAAATVPGRLLRGVTMLLVLCALGVAIVTWVDLSKPFDPPRLEPLAASAVTPATAVPAYPGAVTVLTYHNVSDEDPSTKTLARHTFAEQMATLSALGYRTVPLSTVRDLVRHKPVQLPDRPLLLTFDEGALSTWTTIDPVLERYDYTAAAFLTTDLLVEAGTPSYFLSDRQVRQLKETGRWEFGSHTAGMDKMVPVPGDVAAPMTNRIRTDKGEESVEQWRSRVAADLARSQERLKNLTGSPAVALSYPFGDAGKGSNIPAIGTELPALLEQQGFDVALVGENAPTGHIDAVTESSPRWMLPRIGIRQTTSVENLLKVIRESMPTPMPDRLTDLRWTGDHAECPATAAALAVTSKIRGYGTCSVHDVNTSRWLDYSLDLTVKGLSPRSTAVIGVRDGEGAGHYGRVEVSVGVTRMVIRQRVGAAPIEELITVPLPSATTRKLKVEVRGDVVTVKVKGARAATATFDRVLHEGGVTLARIGAGTVTFADPIMTNHSAP
ncbi:polysaccharide deacetylase family protein [Actinoplanes sp. NPDC051494]|uniref:polysaccharide deacetylase family protein n=1 Tax=Actinoplanes sp. NPDC051494 TaxID=3363907 RepID=UPI00379E66A2